jgi:hypothetical protein
MKYFNLFFTQKVINLLPNEYFSLHFRIFETIRNRYCSGFWRFSLENSKAIINSENGSILPPASKIVYSSDYEAKSDDLASFIAGQKQMNLEASKTDLQIQTDFWKKKLQADQTLEIQGLGVLFVEDGKTHFKGNRLQSDHPDFYGLEEIKISDISNKNTQSEIL